MKTVAFHNLGCKVNAYEIDVMQQKFTENGFRVVPFDQKADVYVVNTCTVTNIADRKSRQMLHRAKALNPDAVVIGTGCYIQTDMEHVKKDPAIDIAIGNNQKSKIVDILNEYLASCGKLSENPAEEESVKNDYVIDINHTNEYESMLLENTSERTRAYIKIEDGCNQFCSYCLIPYARGRVRSRDIDDILSEIKGLAKKGCKEFVLTGIHVSSYGITDPNDLSQNRLANLLEAINAIDDVKRIRLSSLEPRVITEDFVKRISALEKLCPHFHLSLQSGCDETLKRMNRHYTTSQYMEGVKLLRKYFDNPAITTDVIVGFPGETAEEFEASKSFCESVGFYEMHIFKYSKRKGTIAEKLPNQVHDTDKALRSDEMLDLTSRLSKEFRKSHVGSRAEVLFEETKIVNGEAYMTGFTKDYIRVAVKYKENLENEIHTVMLTEMLDDELLKGEIVYA